MKHSYRGIYIYIYIEKHLKVQPYLTSVLTDFVASSCHFIQQRIPVHLIPLCTAILLCVGETSALPREIFMTWAVQMIAMYMSWLSSLKSELILCAVLCAFSHIFECILLIEWCCFFVVVFFFCVCVCVCVCLWERERVCVWVYVRERESVCVCVCMWTDIIYYACLAVLKTM